ncbi:DUF2809 domain-containing protein [Priestia flexa]|jgi:Protein of unknown function (DUF2809)|uniref:ribosomal maturation YjgA family protein n=1 Tax=Priestia flexa TaxID=86664 RepID=UPI001CFEF18A|nr:DUF2809 domain-containing protein [Priestia flexa]UIR28748.1 DUF2809 domain-containing protein [Priestia flexa]UZW64852.1 DUF2809 domain-containing protein [Priestia flexa]
MNSRNRVVYACLCLITTLLGLSTRVFQEYLPAFLRLYIGDTLWALMIFLGFSSIYKTASTIRIIVISILFCYVIECSQLYQAEWIVQLREITLGGLILGYGFLWSDLIAYTVGIAVGGLVELTFKKNPYINDEKY